MTVLAPLLLLAVLPAAAADPAGVSYEVRFTEEKMTLDGHAHEKSWALAPAIELTDRHYPSLMAIDSVSTRVKALWNDKGLMVLYHCLDAPHPGRGRRARRAGVHRRHRGAVPRPGHGRHELPPGGDQSPQREEGTSSSPKPAARTSLPTGIPISRTPSTGKAPSRIGRTGTSGGRWSCSFPGAAWAGRPWT